jgi:hypothetical protein
VGEELDAYDFLATGKITKIREQIYPPREARPSATIAGERSLWSTNQRAEVEGGDRHPRGGEEGNGLAEDKEDEGTTKEKRQTQRRGAEIGMAQGGTMASSAIDRLSTIQTTKQLAFSIGASGTTTAARPIYAVGHQIVAQGRKSPFAKAAGSITTDVNGATKRMKTDLTLPVIGPKIERDGHHCPVVKAGLTAHHQPDITIWMQVEPKPPGKASPD